VGGSRFNEPAGGARQIAPNRVAAADLDKRLMLAVNGFEVGWVVIDEVHVDHDPLGSLNPAQVPE